MRSKGTPEELQRRRLLAVERVSEGYPPAEVADFLGVHPTTVRRWDRDYRLDGITALAACPTPGRPCRLSYAQEKIVFRWLAEKPTALGFASDLWTAPRLALLLAQEFAIHFHPNYLSAWLRQRGYTPQLPRPVHREADERAIARWLAHDWPRIQRKVQRRGACLMFMDESGLLMAPLRRRSWAPRGWPPALTVKTGHREKVSIAGALWLNPSRTRLSFAYQTLVNGYFNNEEVAQFLSGALQWLTTPLVLLWDRGPMHQGSPITQLVAEAEGRLLLEPLPAHAPQLDPVEQVWSWLKYDRLCNFAPQDAHDLNKSVIRELDPIRENQQLLQQLFQGSILPLPRALLT